MDLNYLLFLQNIREATGGVFNSLAIQISDLSYGIFIWLTACIFFWAVSKKHGSPGSNVVNAFKFDAYVCNQSFLLQNPQKSLVLLNGNRALIRAKRIQRHNMGILWNEKNPPEFIAKEF